MLVLRRRIGESFIIEIGSHEIEVLVTDIDGSAAKIGIEADDDVHIIRSELSVNKPINNHKFQCHSFGSSMYGVD